MCCVPHPCATTELGRFSQGLKCIKGFDHNWMTNVETFNNAWIYPAGVSSNPCIIIGLFLIPRWKGGKTCTLRRNLDPFDQYDDATLNNALRSAGLFSLQDELGEARIALDTNITIGGGNLSVGEKQILALARAMIRGSKLLIRTKPLRQSTDSVIQTTLRHELDPDVTVLTVAHRLQTIMDADKIMVLEEGHISEFDTPKSLLGRESSLFKALVDESGGKDALYAIAEGKGVVASSLSV